MPKILYVTTVYQTLEAFISPFAEYYRAKGWQVDGMAAGVLQSEVCKKKFDNLYDVPLSRNMFDISGQIKSSKVIRNVVIKNDYDIVHTHTPIVSFLVRLQLNSIKASLKVKVVYTSHGFHFHDHGKWFNNLFFRWCEKIAGRWTDYLVVINKHDYQFVRENAVVASDRLEKVPGIGVDLSLFNEGVVSDSLCAEKCQSLSIGEYDVVLLMIAEFSIGKRHIDVLEALTHVESTNIRVLFAGAGRLESQLKIVASQLGVSDKVRFLGFQRNVPLLLKLADCVLLPSEREGLPRCLLEAMAMGKACLVSDVRGCHDLVSDSNGYLYPCRDVKGLASMMDWIAKNPQELKDKGIAGKKKVAGYSLETVLDHHDAIYEVLLTEKGSMTDRNHKDEMVP